MSEKVNTEMLRYCGLEVSEEEVFIYGYAPDGKDDDPTFKTVVSKGQLLAELGVAETAFHNIKRGKSLMPTRKEAE